MNTHHVLIETLTPLHIGSGRILQGNTEYLYFSDSSSVAVVDERKILSIIGEENLDTWVQIIEKEQDLLDYVRRRKPTVTPNSVARRIMQAIGTKKPQKWHRDGRDKFPTIREQLFSGNGQPILPGSSLKGAIRTAVLNALIRQNPTEARNILGFKQIEEKNGRRIVKYRGGSLEKKYIGQDPNHDTFKLLRVGDAHFDKTVCLLSETLNEKGGATFEIKDEVKQLIECIPAEAETICRVQIPIDLKARLNDTRYRETATKIPHRDHIEWPALLADINANTSRLIQRELDSYQSQYLPDGANEYLETLRGLMAGLKPNQCVIRVGFGTGYLNMTGGWAEEQWKQALPKDKFDAEMVDLSQAVRHDPKGRYDLWSQTLPKSRKMVTGGIPLGFLKLTVFSESEFISWQSKTVERETQKCLKVEAQRLAQEKADQLAAKVEAERLEKEELKVEEAKKPKLFEGPLKQGQELDAEIIKSGRPNKVKVYALGYESKEFDLIGYAGPEPVGRVIIVKADQLDKKKNLVQVRYSKFK